MSSTVWTHVRIGATLGRLLTPIAFWAMSGVALLLSHDAVFLVQLGPGEELTRTLREAGHEYWGWASMALALVGLAVGIAAVLHLRSLRLRASELLVAPIASRWALPGRFAATWLRLFGLVAIGFVLQENVEHFISHGHALGLNALFGHEYPLALPVIGLITALAAVVAAAVQRTERELLSLICAALQRPLRGPRTLGRPSVRLALPRLSPLAHAVAGRAPPHAFVFNT